MRLVAHLLVAACLAPLVAPAAEFPLPTTSYSAVRVIETDDGSFETAIYYENQKERSEIRYEGDLTIAILRHDLGVMWMLLPERMYLEQPLGMFAPGTDSGTAAVNYLSQAAEIVDEGRDVLDGVSTQRYSMRTQNPDGSVITGQVWMTNEQIPLRTHVTIESPQDRDEVLIRLTDLDLGDQPDDLFEIPAGYQRLDISTMPGNIFGGGGTATGTSDPSFSDELTDAVQEGAEDAVIDETRRGVRDAVSRGLRGLFDRN